MITIKIPKYELERTGICNSCSKKANMYELKVQQNNCSSTTLLLCEECLRSLKVEIENTLEE